MRLRLRGNFTGLALDPSGQPVDGVTVTVTQGTTPRGDGLSDGTGRFVTGPDYPVAAMGATIDAHGIGTITLGVEDREIRRVCPSSTTEPEKYPWLHNTYDGRAWLATVNVNGDVRVRWSPSHIALQNNWKYKVDVTDTGDCRWPTICQDPACHRRTYLIYERTTGDLWSSASDDYGQTWQTPVLFQANARRGMTACNASGDLIQAWFVYVSGTSGPGNIMVQFRGRGQTSWGTPVKAKDQTGTVIEVIDGGFSNVEALVASYDPFGMSVILNGGTTPVNYVCTDYYAVPGLTWLQV